VSTQTIYLKLHRLPKHKHVLYLNLIRLEVAWHRRLVCPGYAACRPTMECYNPNPRTKKSSASGEMT